MECVNTTQRQYKPALTGALKIQIKSSYCCRHSTGIKHFNVERTTTTFYLKDIQFTTLDQLVRYYSQADVPNKELIRGVRLRSPIYRTGPSLRMYDDSEGTDTNNTDVYIHPVCNTTVIKPQEKGLIVC